MADVWVLDISFSLHRTLKTLQVSAAPKRSKGIKEMKTDPIAQKHECSLQNPFTHAEHLACVGQNTTRHSRSSFPHTPAMLIGPLQLLERVSEVAADSES
jgi:hypothetical protein